MKNTIKKIGGIVNRSPAHGETINALDGIRALAVLLVLASHTDGFHLTGQGSIGVWLFFVLSGFLLALPFANNPVKANSFVGILEFAFRRLKRILPMYFIALVLFYFLYPGFITDFKELAKHFLFINANGHFWSTQQEMVFYLFMPALLYLSYLISKIVVKGNKVIIGCLLLILALILNKYLTISVFYLLGNYKEQPFYIAIFLTGMALAYFYSHFKSSEYLENKKIKYSLNTLAVSILIIFFISAKYYKDKIGLIANVDYLGWEYPLAFAFLSGMLILSITLNRDGLLNKIFSSRVLRSIGVVSYSMYLIHYLLLHYLSEYILNNNILFFVLTFLTYLVSSVTYYYIERPFIKLKVTFRKETNLINVQQDQIVH
jgi:peptidoglycan/LPS O-acetylase OafA/YrhL